MNNNGYNPFLVRVAFPLMCDKGIIIHNLLGDQSVWTDGWWLLKQKTDYWSEEDGQPYHAYGHESITGLVANPVSENVYFTVYELLGNDEEIHPRFVSSWWLLFLAKSRQSYLLHSHDALKIVCKSNAIAEEVAIHEPSWLPSDWSDAALLLWE